MQNGTIHVVVAGGGAAGFFGALTCASEHPDVRVTLLEKSPEPLAKVAISGGGRCNVTHACFDPQRLAEGYPRGARELLGPLHRWQPRDTVEWFESRGVSLKTEPDGRMFPVSDRAESITHCLEAEAQRLGVEIRTGCGLREARFDDGCFALRLSTGETMNADRLLLATGGNAASLGFEIAASLGHTIETPVPSLFTFHVDDPRISGLAGISVSSARVRAEGLQQEGPLLLTHWGMSGPAILRLSAWGARLLHDRGYRFNLEIDWLPGKPEETVRDALAVLRNAHASQRPATRSPFGLPLRLWQSLVAHAGLQEDARWGGLSSQAAEALLAGLKRACFEVTGRSLNKEEFVTCGGIVCKEVDFRTMQSRVCPGLYLAGELLDIDGVTGGYNLQAAWTTGRIAGESMGLNTEH